MCRSRRSPRWTEACQCLQVEALWRALHDLVVLDLSDFPSNEPGQQLQRLWQQIAIEQVSDDLPAAGEEGVAWSSELQFDAAGTSADATLTAGVTLVQQHLMARGYPRMDMFTSDAAAVTCRLLVQRNMIAWLPAILLHSSPQSVDHPPPAVQKPFVSPWLAHADLQRSWQIPRSVSAAEPLPSTTAAVPSGCFGQC